MKLSKENKKLIRTELKNHFGHCNLSKIRKELKAAAINKYDCYFIEIKLNNGISVCYTSNPNHFASYYLKLQLVGMVNTLALTKSDLTKRGRINCSEYFSL